MLIRRTEEAAKYLEATKLQTSNGYTEEFTVMEDLMGLAIGNNAMCTFASLNYPILSLLRTQTEL